MKNLRGITAASVEKYLLFTGWERDNGFKNPKLLVFFKKDDPDFRLAIPANESGKDFYPRIYDIATTLSEYNNISFEETIESLKSAYTDRIQIRIITEKTDSGKVPLSYAAQCVEGLKDLVLYAACAEEHARPVCSRTYVNAKSKLDKFQFAQTEYGSFIFNIDVQVADEENEQLYLLEAAPSIPEPTEHKVVKRIKTAIEQVDRVVKDEIRIGDLITNAYEDGITANMCDALSKLKSDDIGDVSIETTFRFAEAITQSASTPIKNTLNNIHFAYFNEISKRYKDKTLVEDVVLRGMIKMLSKDTIADNAETENTIRLYANVDNQLRSITLRLSPADHTAACNAYRDDKEVQVEGTLDKSQSRWFFSEVTRFEVIE